MRLAGIAAPVPAGLQRFNLVLNVTSSLRPGEHHLSAVKGLVADSLREWWTHYAPVVISSLPYHKYEPVRLTACAEGFAGVYFLHRGVKLGFERERAVLPMPPYRTWLLESFDDRLAW